MLKSDLVRRIWQQNSHLQRQEVETIVHAIFNEITATLARGVELRGFGAFSIKVREARTGRNPRTGMLISVSKRAFPHSKSGLEMRERLNRSEE